MKLLFWKPKHTNNNTETGASSIKTKEEYIRDYLLGESAPDRFENENKVSDAEPEEVINDKPNLSTKEDQHISQEIKQVLEDTRRYKVLAIKKWCERRLTPVAYARVLVRILPVIREYGYNFGDLQHPTDKTRIKHDFFLVMRATIKEIYKEEYNKLEPSRS